MKRTKLFWTLAGSGVIVLLLLISAFVFFVLTLSLSLLNASQARNKKSNLERTLQSVKEAPAALPPGPIKPVPTNHSIIPTNISGTTPAAPAPAKTNQLLLAPPAAEKGK